MAQSAALSAAAMRHESIEATLRYYVGRNVQTTADVVWAASEKEQAQDAQESTAVGTISPHQAKSLPQETTQALENQGLT